MPTYTFRNNDTREEWTDMMSISSCESFLKDNPHIEQIPVSINLGPFNDLPHKRPDEGFREIMKRIKKNAPRSKINVR